MELQRGSCSLCLENNKVLTPSDAEEFNKFLPRILHENFLTETEFQKIKDSLKICVICCYKIQAANEARKAIKSATSEVEEQNCHFCKGDKYVIKVKDDWKYFTLRVEGFVKPTEFPLCVCPSCLFYFDTIFNFKTKLTHKFPQLAVFSKSKSNSKQQNETPKRKSQSKSPPGTKKRKIFSDCFNYLQPLCNNNYYVEENLKGDSRLYRKIAYVNLADVNNIKETPKVRPVIKIKLKRKSKKLKKNTSKVMHESLQGSGFKTQPYIKLCKSEEILSKVQKNKAKTHSQQEQKQTVEEVEDEKIDETPKAAATVNLVPMRRVSLFQEPVEVESEEKDKDTQSDSEDITKIVNKYIKDSTFDDGNKLDLLEEVSEKKPEDKIDENGIEKSTIENGKEDVSIEIQENIEIAGSDNTSEEIMQEKKEEEKLTCEKSESSLTSVESGKTTPPKSENSNEESDSDLSDKDKSQDNFDGDSLNGSERKKKRVTFSDEVN